MQLNLSCWGMDIYSWAAIALHFCSSDFQFQLLFFYSQPHCGTAYSLSHGGDTICWKGWQLSQVTIFPASTCPAHETEGSVLSPVPYSGDWLSFTDWSRNWELDPCLMDLQPGGSWCLVLKLGDSACVYMWPGWWSRWHGPYCGNIWLNYLPLWVHAPVIDSWAWVWSKRTSGISWPPLFLLSLATWTQLRPSGHKRVMLDKTE